MAAPYNLSFNPVWDFVNLTGQQVDDTYYLFTLSNIFPYAYSPVYMSQSGGYWSDPIQLLSNGTLPTNVYWDPDVVYRLELRQGNMQSDPLIYLIENYIPIDSGTGPGPTPSPGNNSTDNLITNPQFIDVPFVSPFTINTAGTTQIAPGWQITTTGSGTLTVSQVNISGINAISPNGTNESYYLSIANNSFSTVTLQQVFNMNGALWTGQAAALSFSVNPNAPVTIDSYLTYSGNVQQSVSFINQLINSTGWQSLTAAVSIDPSVNTNVGVAAYTTLNIMWSGNLTVNITSIQLLGQKEADDSVSYGQIPIERQIDHEFHYYQPQLNFKPIPSLLTGWDFPLNPAQLGTSQTITTTPAYIWDQTIAASFSGTLAVTRNTNTGALQLVTSSANQACYLMQYLSGPQAFETVLSNLAVNLNVYATNASNVTASVYLCYSPTGVIPPLGTSIGAINADGTFTLTPSNGWSFVPQLYTSNGVSLSGLLANTNISNDLRFKGWNGSANIGTSTGNPAFAIIVTFLAPTNATVVEALSISCVAGTIPTRPAPQTADEVLRECQYYYEKSYGQEVLPGATGAPAQANQIVAPMGYSATSGPNYGIMNNAFGCSFNTIKRTVPTLTVYSIAGTSANTSFYYYFNGALTGPVNAPLSTYWTVSTSGTKAFSFACSRSTLYLQTGLGAVSSYIAYNYVADARLGIV